MESVFSKTPLAIPLILAACSASGAVPPVLTCELMSEREELVFVPPSPTGRATITDLAESTSELSDGSIVTKFGSDDLIVAASDASAANQLMQTDLSASLVDASAQIERFGAKAESERLLMEAERAELEATKMAMSRIELFRLRSSIERRRGEMNLAVLRRDAKTREYNRLVAIQDAYKKAHAAEEHYLNELLRQTAILAKSRGVFQVAKHPFQKTPYSIGETLRSGTLVGRIMAGDVNRAQCLVSPDALKVLNFPLTGTLTRADVPYEAVTVELGLVARHPIYTSRAPSLVVPASARVPAFSLPVAPGTMARLDTGGAVRVSKNVVDLRHAPGVIASAHSRYITAPPNSVSPQVAVMFLAKEGSVVKKGDVILQVDSVQVRRRQSELRSSLKDAEATELEVAELAEAQKGDLSIQRAILSAELSEAVRLSGIPGTLIGSAKASRNSAMRLAKTIEFESHERYERKLAEVMKLRMQAVRQKVNQIQRKLTSIDRQIEAFDVVAPFEGVVKVLKAPTGKSWSIGDSPFTSQRIIELSSTSELRIEVEVPEQSVDLWLPGRRLRVEAESNAEVKLELANCQLVVGEHASIAGRRGRTCYSEVTERLRGYSVGQRVVVNLSEVKEQ